MTPKKFKKQTAFSLIEVVVSMAIVVFAGFALIGLLGLGLQNTQDSRQRLQAASIAEAICSTRRGAATNDLTSVQPNFPLPPLNPSSGNANNLNGPPFLYLSWDGAITNQPNASFGLVYNVNSTGTSPGYATAYMCFFWPAQANPTNAATGHYEITTTFGLP
ncbi:MAG: hypothetical protein LV479_11505 [Methylacidiphilales bacterium]|nr:hypothetical protein [Candidatus Methylacidiphilales bacterium]